MKTIVCVVGARPNFMKIAPIVRAFGRRPQLRCVLVHTGQHYGADMSQSFFDELGIPEPQINLEVGSGSHAVQTAEVMKRFEPVLDRGPVDAVLVVGDVNSTIACALVAAKKGIPVIHVEAGLRSFDRTMPEEINRVLTDQISDLLFTTEPDAATNLAREGIDPARVIMVGNVMIDTLMHSLDRAVPAAETLSDVLGGAGRAARLLDSYALMTLHRPATVDDPAVLGPLLETVATLSQQVPVVFPMHPRTANSIRSFELTSVLERGDIVTMAPQSYLRLLGLLRQARLVLTDSGGLQEESTALGIPCLTLRPNTERPITVSHGSNRVVGTAPQDVTTAFADFIAGRSAAGRIPPLWDGQAAERIADAVVAWLGR
jgi:UDP-N-acetylglucosamine 2-epimerase (non-hydrolysing)